jgi:hypothetical protein
MYLSARASIGTPQNRLSSTSNTFFSLRENCLGFPHDYRTTPSLVKSPIKFKFWGYQEFIEFHVHFNQQIT